MLFIEKLRGKEVENKMRVIMYEAIHGRLTTVGSKGNIEEWFLMFFASFTSLESTVVLDIRDDSVMMHLSRACLGHTQT